MVEIPEMEGKVKEVCGGVAMKAEMKDMRFKGRFVCSICGQGLAKPYLYKGREVVNVIHSCEGVGDYHFEPIDIYFNISEGITRKKAMAIIGV